MCVFSHSVLLPISAVVTFLMQFVNRHVLRTGSDFARKYLFTIQKFHVANGKLRIQGNNIPESIIVNVLVRRVVFMDR